MITGWQFYIGLPKLHIHSGLHFILKPVKKIENLFIAQSASGFYETCWRTACAPTACAAHGISNKSFYLKSVSERSKRKLLFRGLNTSAYAVQQENNGTPEDYEALRLRQIWCEGNFSHQKANHNLSKVRKRGLGIADEHYRLSAAVFNLKRMVKLLQTSPPQVPHCFAAFGRYLIFKYLLIFMSLSTEPFYALALFGCSVAAVFRFRMKCFIDFVSVQRKFSKLHCTAGRPEAKIKLDSGDLERQGGYSYLERADQRGRDGVRGRPPFILRLVAEYEEP